MKRLRVFAVFSLLLFFVNCVTHTKITYYIPPDYPQARRDQLIDLFYKGEALYKDNCSTCHGIFTKGKDSVPNFTNQQLDNYTTRYIRGDVRNHAVARQMSPVQLNNIMVFLRYLKRNSDTGATARRIIR